jgi:hypothetical protein
MLANNSFNKELIYRMYKKLNSIKIPQIIQLNMDERAEWILLKIRHTNGQKAVKTT